MSSLRTLLLIGITLCRPVFSQDYLVNNYFVNPTQPGENNDFSENPTYQWGSYQTLQWRSEWSNINLKIYQNNNPNFYIFTPNNLRVQGAQTYGYNSTFDTNILDLTLPLIFFFRMNNVNDDSETFSSHYFSLVDLPRSITNPSPSAVAVSNPIPSPTPAPVASVEPSTTAAAVQPSTSASQAAVSQAPSQTKSEMVSQSATQSASQTASQSTSTQATAQPEQFLATPGLSYGAKAGIGIGCAAVALLAIGGIVFLCMQRKKNADKKKLAERNTAAAAAAAAATPGARWTPHNGLGLADEKSTYNGRYGPAAELSDDVHDRRWRNVHEVSAYRTPQELP